VRELTPADWQELSRLLSENPDLTMARIRELVEQQNRSPRRRVAEAVRPRTTGDIAELFKLKLITKAEARRYLKLATPTRAARAPVPTPPAKRAPSPRRASS
jgi:hypothetical protein